MGTVRALGTESPKYNRLPDLFQWDILAEFTEEVALASSSGRRGLVIVLIPPGYREEHYMRNSMLRVDQIAWSPGGLQHVSHFLPLSASFCLT